MGALKVGKKKIKPIPKDWLTEVLHSSLWKCCWVLGIHQSILWSQTKRRSAWWIHPDMHTACNVSCVHVSVCVSTCVCGGASRPAKCSSTEHQPGLDALVWRGFRGVGWWGWVRCWGWLGWQRGWVKELRCKGWAGVAEERPHSWVVPSLSPKGIEAHQWPGQLGGCQHADSLPLSQSHPLSFFCQEPVLSEAPARTLSPLMQLGFLSEPMKAFGEPWSACCLCCMRDIWSGNNFPPLLKNCSVW